MAKANKEGQRKAPILRFKGFTDDWEQQQLGEIFKFSQGLQVPIDQQFEKKEENTERFIRIVDVTQDNIPQRFVYNPTGKGRVNLDDIFFVRYGAVGTIGHGFKGVIANNLFKVIPLIDINPLFWFYQFSDIRFNSRLKALSASTSMSAINFNTLRKMIISNTSIVEQNKIGTILKSLDDLLTLYERKIKLLSQEKKYFLDNLFAGKEYPNLRFKGFTDAWEQRKLGKVATFINGRAYKQNELLDSGKYKVLRVGNFYTNDSWYYSNLELADKYYIDKGDLVYTWSATFGPHIWNGEKVIYHYHIWKIELSKFLDRYFTLQILEADKAKLLANTNGSTMIHVTKKGMESKVISLPTIEEQKQIGLYLTEFDTLIALYENKKQNLIEIKKSLLNTMFI